MKPIFKERFFKNADEWNYFLHQLNIPEDIRHKVSEVTLNVFRDEVELRDDSNDIITWEEE